MRIAFLLLCIGSCVSASGQAGQSKRPESLIDRACAGESEAITEVENSPDSLDLQRMMHDPDCSMNVGARFALAKRGDHEALQFYACKSLTDKFEVMQLLLKGDLAHLGGEFTVEVYRQLLDSNQRFQVDLTRVQKGCSDCIIMPLSDEVPLMLQQLLPDAPVPSLTPLQRQANPQTVETVKSIWRSWTHPQNGAQGDDANGGRN